MNTTGKSFMFDIVIFYVLMVPCICTKQNISPYYPWKNSQDSDKHRVQKRYAVLFHRLADRLQPAILDDKTLNSTLEESYAKKEEEPYWKCFSNNISCFKRIRQDSDKHRVQKRYAVLFHRLADRLQPAIQDDKTLNSTLEESYAKKEEEPYWKCFSNNISCFKRIRQDSDKHRVQKRYAVLFHRLADRLQPAIQDDKTLNSTLEESYAKKEEEPYWKCFSNNISCFKRIRQDSDKHRVQKSYAVLFHRLADRLKPAILDDKKLNNTLQEPYEKIDREPFWKCYFNNVSCFKRKREDSDKHRVQKRYVVLFHRLADRLQHAIQDDKKLNSTLQEPYEKIDREPFWKCYFNNISCFKRKREVLKSVQADNGHKTKK